MMLNVTVYAQCSIHGEKCIHYSERQDINCLRCLQNEPLNDSIIADQKKIISKQEIFIESTNQTISSLDTELTESKNQTSKEKTKKKNAIIGAISAGFVAVIEGVVLFFAFK